VARIEQVDPRNATGRAGELMEEVNARLGSIPGMTKTMAVAPVSLEGWHSRSVPGRRAGGHGGDKQRGDS
jgi:hypothetical protein